MADSTSESEENQAHISALPDVEHGNKDSMARNCVQPPEGITSLFSKIVTSSTMDDVCGGLSKNCSTQPGEKTTSENITCNNEMDCSPEEGVTYSINLHGENDSGIDISKSPHPSGMVDATSLADCNESAISSKVSDDLMDDSVLDPGATISSTPLTRCQSTLADDKQSENSTSLVPSSASLSSIDSPYIPADGIETPLPSNEVSDESSPFQTLGPDSDSDDEDDIEHHRDRDDDPQGDEEENDVADTTKSDDSDDENGMDTSAQFPKDTWMPLREIQQRELGFSSHLPHAALFRNQAGASINLTMRLKMFTTLDYHEGCVNALHFNKSGTLLSSGSDDLNIVIWDWARCKRAFYFHSGHRSNVFQCKFMPYTGDCHMVSCARDGQVRLAELSSMAECKSTRKLAQHKGAAHKLALLEDSSHVFYSCGEDGAVFEIDLRQDKPHKLCITKDDSSKVALYSIHANPFKSQEFCVGGRDHIVRIYDKRMIGNPNDGGETLKKFFPHHLVNSDTKANVTCAVYNHDGTEVLASYNDEDIYLFDNDHSDGADSIHKYTGHRNNATVKGVNMYGPRSEYIVSGSDCGNVFLWHKETEQIVNYFHADEGGVVNVLEPHPQAPVLATSGLDHDVKIWVPTSSEPAALDKLKQVVRRNRKEREEERSHEPDMDSQMFWFLMQNLRRTARRRAREDGEELSSTSDSETDSDDSAGHGPVSCSQS